MTLAGTLKQEETKKRIRFLLKFLVYLALLLSILNLPVFLEENVGLPKSLLDAVMFYLAAHLVVSFGRIIAVFFYLRKNHIKKEVKNNFVIGINRIADVLGVFVFLFSLIVLTGRSPLEFITSLSIVAAAIAILSKDYISNMINGMIIMFSNEISIGDHVRIGNQKGKVMDITLTNVHLVNEDEDLVYIPNSVVLNSESINLTKRSIRKLSFEFDLKNNYLADVAAIEKELFLALEDFHTYIRKDSFTLKIVKINENFTSMKVQFVINKAVNIELEKQIRRKTLRTVLALANVSK